MIRINKTKAIPGILSGDGAVQTNALNNAYAANPQLYTSAVGVKNSSLKPMQINPKVYGDATVKDLLKMDQHQKCCFCESLFSETSYGDVEHFRPKRAYKKKGTKGFVYPGYYWLVYEWNNLLFSCEICNRSYKKNEFPIGLETTRKLFHNHPNLLSDEDRLLIDPTIEDPADFITFKQEVPVAVGGSLKGTKTIEVLELDRMNDSRLKHIHALKALSFLTAIDPNNDEQLDKVLNALNTTKTRGELVIAINEANNIFHNAAKDSSKFAHCVRCNFPELPIV